MKGKRQKHQRKCLTFYQKNFGHKPPYKLLIDGTFCKAALKFKVNIMEQMPKYLEAEVRYFTTKCCIAECEALGKYYNRDRNRTLFFFSKLKGKNVDEEGI